MNASQEKRGHLSDATLDRIAGRLSDLYFGLYDERPVDPRASLTSNLLAYVFEDGLSVSDQWMLRTGRGERLREFRQGFFEVVTGEMVRVVGDLTGLVVTYSFYGFDPQTRTSHLIFVLDMSSLRGVGEGQARMDWSEAVGRNASRPSERHPTTDTVQEALREQARAQRDEVRRETAADESARRGQDDPESPA